MSKYRIKRKYAHRKQLITTIEGEAVNLIGSDVSKTIKATADRPEQKVNVRGAKQEDLKELYEGKKYGDYSRIIEKVDGNAPDLFSGTTSSKDADKNVDKKK